MVSWAVAHPRLPPRCVVVSTGGFPLGNPFYLNRPPDPYLFHASITQNGVGTSVQKTSTQVCPSPRDSPTHQDQLSNTAGSQPNTAPDVIEMLHASIIGGSTNISGPFGPRRIVYVDYTASGRALECIENVIHKQVLPLYANTHSELSHNGLQVRLLDCSG